MIQKLLNELKPIAEKEYSRAVIDWGYPHSKHEGYAVMLEEIEEAEKEIASIVNYAGDIWYYVKTNHSDVAEYLKVIERNSLCLAAEALQIYATARKFRVFEEVVCDDVEGTAGTNHRDDSAREIKR